MRWAIVIGIDEYGDAGMRLSASVSDALKFRDWVLAPDGGGVGEENLRLLLSRRPDDPGLDGTKLRIFKGTDEGWLRELFSPAFQDWLARSADDFGFDGLSLPGHAETPADRAFCRPLAPA